MSDRPNRVKFVEKVFKKNNKSVWGLSRLAGDGVTVDVSSYAVDVDKISFEEDAYPYLRLALLDTYMEREIL